MRGVIWALGLAAAVAFSPGAAWAFDYAPLRCGAARSAAQHAICGSYALGQQEARMATLYGVAMSLVGMGQRGDLGDQQILWLNRREACGRSVACLQRAYRARIAVLTRVLDAIAKGGPY